MSIFSQILGSTRSRADVVVIPFALLDQFEAVGQVETIRGAFFEGTDFDGFVGVVGFVEDD